MDGHSPYRLWGLGPDRFVLAGSFQTNAGSNPSSSTYRGKDGLAFTVTYAATGVFTVTLPAGFRLPAQPLAIGAWAQFADLATDWFEVAVVGETTLNASTRQFVLQAHRSGVAREVANTAGNRINFHIFTQNNTGA
jgi:hypothetical protein